MRGQRTHGDRVPRESQLARYVLVAHVKRGDRRGRPSDPEAPFQARIPPGARDAHVRREHALHLPQEGGDRFQHREVHGVRLSAHGKGVRQLALGDGGEREVERQARRDVEDLLAPTPEMQPRVEPAPPVLEVPIHVGHAEFAEGPVGHRQRAVVFGLRARAGEADGRRHGARDAARILLEQGVHARQREPLYLEVRVGASAGRQVALQNQAPRVPHAVQRGTGDPDHGVVHRDLGRCLQKPHPAGQQHGERIHGDGHRRGIAWPGRAPREAAPRENRAEVADPRACKPRQRVARPAQRAGRRTEAVRTEPQRVERRVEPERRDGAGLVRTVQAARGNLPVAPAHALGVGARLHGHRIERTLQGEQDARRALERAPAPHGRGVAPNDPGHERVERVEAVGVEIEREHAPGRAPPAEGTGPGRDEATLRHAQRVDVQPTVRKAHRGAAAVERRPGKHRRGKRRGQRALRGRGAVPRGAARDRDVQARAGQPADPRREVEVPRGEREMTRSGALVEQREDAVDPCRSRPCSGRELGVGLESGGRAGEPHWALDGAAQPEAGEAAAQPVEGERIGVHVGEEPDRVGARVEPDRAANHARRARAVALREGAREPGVVQRPRERTGPGQLPAQRDGGRQPADRAEIHGRRLHGERLEVDAVRRDQVHLALATDARHGPTGDERVSKRPVQVQGERFDLAIGGGMPGEPPVEGKRLDEAAREIEVEIGRHEIGTSYRDETGIGRGHHGEPAGERAAGVPHVERIELHFEEAAAVRPESHAAPVHRASRKASGHEARVLERGGVGAQREVVEEGAPGPAHPPARGQPRGRKLHARQVGLERIADDGDLPRGVAHLDAGIRAGHRELRDVDPDPAVLRGRDA